MTKNEAQEMIDRQLDKLTHLKEKLDRSNEIAKRVDELIRDYRITDRMIKLGKYTPEEIEQKTYLLAIECGHLIKSWKKI
jgi:hypothetical protein